MKSISIFFIASKAYHKRLVDIIANNVSGLLCYNFSIIAKEGGHNYNYIFDDLISSRWLNSLPAIYPGLRDNIALLGGDISNLPHILDLSYTQDSLPMWLRPRQLNYGDLSVISKHHQSVNAFLRTTDDYALICEDDVVFNDSALRSIHLLAQGLQFDFIDIAGGDSLHTSNINLVIDNTFQLEKKTNCATRTACCYLISRRYAEKLSSVLDSPFFPIDWSMSLAFSLFMDTPLVYWLHTSLADHGSCTGKVTSWRLLS